MVRRLQDPALFPTSHQLRRVDTGKLSRVALLYVDSPEPVKLLSSLFTGPQYGLLEDPPTPRNVLVLAGPAGVGKTAVLRMLLQQVGWRMEGGRRVRAAGGRRANAGGSWHHCVA